MFSVYSNENSIFNGTLENLVKVKPPPAVQASSLPTVQPQLQGSQATYQPSRGAVDTYRDLIKADPKDEIFHVHEVMLTDHLQIFDDLPLHEALVQMTENKTSAAAVINRQGRFVGVLNSLSVIARLVEPQADLAELRISLVRNFLLPEAIITAPVTSVRRVAQVMRAYALELIPVVDQFEIVVGVVTPLALAQAIPDDPPISVWT